MSWTRVGTTLTLHHAAHGHAMGSRALIKEANVAFVNSLITGVTTDTFTVTRLDSGATSGVCVYTLGITYAQIGADTAVSGGTVTIPASVKSMIISKLQWHFAANTRSGITFMLYIPAMGANMGVGDNSVNDDFILPVASSRQDDTNLTNTTVTYYKTLGASPAIQFNLAGVTTGIYLAASF